MSEQRKIGITRNHVLAAGLGIGGGVLGTLLFTKWLPAYREDVARRQGAIMAEEFVKRTGLQYGQTQGSGNPGNSSDIYSIQNTLNAINARLDDFERQLQDYKGANQ